MLSNSDSILLSTGEKKYVFLCSKMNLTVKIEYYLHGQIWKLRNLCSHSYNSPNHSMTSKIESALASSDITAVSDLEPVATLKDVNVILS